MMTINQIACVVAAALGSVQAHGQGNRWTLATADTQMSVEVRDGRLMIGELRGPEDTHDWAAGGMVVPLMNKVWVGSGEVPKQWKFVDGAFQPKTGTGPREVATPWKFVSGALDEKAGTLTLGFSNAEPRLNLRSVWRARPGHGPVEHWIEIENQSPGAVTVPAQDSLSLARLQTGGPADVWWIKRGGSNASTEGGAFTEPVEASLNCVLKSDCEDGASPVPWAAVQQRGQRGLYVGWEFSGLGRVQARAGEQAGQLGITVGFNPDFKTDVEPGEVFLVPPAFVGCYRGDMDEGSYCLHRFIIEKLRPSVPENVPDPTLAYNLYLDAGGDRATEADVLRSARFCRDLGFDTFMPDAMWFPACGDWRWDPARFPNGVKPIAEYVHRNGMHMALWCAWTNGGVSSDPEALSVRGPAGRPDWFNADYPPDWKPGPFYGGQLCLGCKEAREWAIRKTQWLVSYHQLDYLKHDCGPIVTRCSKTTHRHKYGVDVSYWATLGYYEVQEKLRQAFPNILLENCSGGGHIKDFGVIRYTHYTVTTDTLSNLPDRQSIWDSSYAFPPLVLQAYTYEGAYNVKGDDPCSFLWRSAMMSAWQIDPTKTAKWTEEDRESAKRAAAIYKEWIRPMLQDVKVHHILPRPDGKHWDGMFYWSAPLKTGMLFIFRPDAAEERRTIKLKGLDPGQKYEVWCEEGSVSPGVRSGRELMADGLAIGLDRRYSSDLVFVRDASLGKPKGMKALGEFKLAPARAQSDPFVASAVLTWEPCAHARIYRVVVSEKTDLETPLINTRVRHPSAALPGLPGGKTLYWRVQAIGWAGRQWSAGEAAVLEVPALKPLPGVTFASDLPWVRSNAGAENTVRRDVTRLDKPISIAGKIYPKGVWTHAFNDATPADVVFDAAGRKYVAFAADVGVDDAAGGGSVQFQVIVDGMVAAESPVIHPGQVHRFQVDVAGAGEVILRVMNGGDGYACDHAAWGLARFLDTTGVETDSKAW